MTPSNALRTSAAAPRRQAESKPSLILVGLSQDPAAMRVAEALAGLAPDAREAREPDDLNGLLRGRPQAAIVVFSRRCSRDAHRVLASVAQAGRNTPVVVVADEADFGEYYTLMGMGAVEYFEISEQPEVIARGVAWAMRACAA